MTERIILTDPQRAILTRLSEHEQGLQGVDAKELFSRVEGQDGFSRTKLEQAAVKLQAEELLELVCGTIRLTRAGYLCGTHNICGRNDPPGPPFLPL